MGSAIFLAIAASIPLDEMVLLASSATVVVIALLVLVMAFVLLLKYGLHKLVGTIGVAHFFAYPPAVAGAFVGVAVTTICIQCDPSLISFADTSSQKQHFVVQLAIGYAWGVVGSLAVVLLLSWFAFYVATRAVSSRKFQSQKPGMSEELQIDGCFQFDRIVEWIENDREILHPSMDVFLYSRIAERIAHRLMPGASTPPSTVALIGELGSGKTSIRNLTQHIIAGTSKGRVRTVIIPISLWPFSSTDSAVLGILDRIISELGLYVDTLGIRRLPERYIKSIEKIDRWGYSAPLLVRRPDTPEDLLGKLEEIAIATRINAIVWIEDLERFSGGDSSVPESISERERLSPIRALLYMLQSKKNLCVVVASTSLGVRFDLEKIANFVENIPVISEETTRPILRKFTEGCLSQLDGLINSGNQNLGSDASREYLARHFGLSRRATKFSAIAKICRTPRTLKQTLRSCWEVWSFLKGEINFEDVLIMSAIRIVEPDIFALVNKHINRLQAGDLLSKSRIEDKEGKAFNSSLERLLSHDSSQSDAIVFLLERVFPGWKNSPGDESRTRPQGFGFRSTANYWNRFLSLSNIPAEEQDQPVLKALAECNKGSLSQIIVCFDDPIQGEKVESFSNRLKRDALAKLFERIVLIRIRQGPAEWPKFSEDVSLGEVPGFIRLWRMVSLHGDEDGVFADLVMRLTSQSMQENLVVADSLYFMFATRSSAENRFFGGQEMKSIEEKVHEGFVRFTKCAPDDFVRAMKGAPHLLLSRLCWGVDRHRSGDMSGDPFEGWVSFSTFLIDAIPCAPQVVIPQIAGFFIRVTEEMGGPIVTADTEGGRRLFDWKSLQSNVQGYPIDPAEGHAMLVYRKLIELLADPPVKRTEEPEE